MTNELKIAGYINGETIYTRRVHLTNKIYTDEVVSAPNKRDQIEEKLALSRIKFPEDSSFSSALDGVYK